MTTRFFLLTLVLLVPALLHAELVTYEFDIDFKEINITGNPVRAMAIGDSIPAPTLTGRVGDTLRVTFNNNLPVDSIVHWHGVLLPHDQDGVPFLNTRNIAPNSSFTFEFPILHKGTYWYHSHSELQEQRGIYGALIFEPEQGETYDYQEEVVMLSDWNDEDPDSMLSNLKRNGAYYAFKKDNVQAWDGVLANGATAISNRINQSWTRMGPMDLSDIGYDEFLVNGQQQATLLLDNSTTPDRIVLRVVNSSASSYFNVEYAGGPMTLLSADGVDIEPIQVQRLRMATAETYDIEVATTPGKAFEFRASSIDGTGFSSLFVGNGERVLAPDIPKPNLYLDNSMHEMDMSDGMSQMNMPQTANEMPMPKTLNRENLEQTTVDHSTGDHEHNNNQHEGTGTTSMMMAMNEGAVIEYMDDYESLISREDTEFSDVKEWREIRLELTGNMERYIWSMNDKTLAKDAQIVIRKGENVRLILVNNTMMYHPMHLHGHFFRVVNQHGSRSPLKHTVDVAPMAAAVIEFKANEDKDWLFHCHNLYHMKTGMNRVISYELSLPYLATLSLQPSIRIIVGTTAAT
jgi:CopA family copper-resistance protein